MSEPNRRGSLELPSGQLHGTSFNIVPAGLQGDRGGYVAVRLSAVVAAFVLTWTVVSGIDVDAAQSAFTATMLGFAWHAGARFTWGK